MRRSFRRHSTAVPEVPATFWMIAFSDLLTLLITFFVMRLSTKSLDKLSMEELFRTAGPAVVATLETTNEVTAMLTTELQRVLGAPIARDEEQQTLQYQNGIHLKPTARGSMVWLSGGLFLPGSDELSLQAEYALRALSWILREQDVEIEIAGHTDNIPINSPRFPSNWELSTARAIALTRGLIKAGVEGHRISAVGYADMRPKADNSTEEGRQINRRVEIAIHPRSDKTDIKAEISANKQSEHQVFPPAEEPFPSQIPQEAHPRNPLQRTPSDRFPPDQFSESRSGP